MRRQTLRFTPACLLCLIVLATLGSNPTAAQGPLSPKDLKPESLQRWGQAEMVFVGNLAKVIAGPVGLSEPPLHTFTMKLVPSEMLRGLLPLGEQVTAHYAIKQKNPPVFPEGKNCIVSLSKVKGEWRIQTIVEATEPEVKQAQLACLVPLGWTLKDGALYSPWTEQGKKAWPADAKGMGWICVATGRPAYTAGPGVIVSAEPVPPKEAIKFQNPDGDGEYKITVTNTTKKTVTVPALLSDGKNILWDDSLVILCQKKAYPIPGSTGVKAKPDPVQLKAGESISTVVNVLKLQGPEWPKGGYRIEFQFCLGDQSSTQSFYYYSKHHDPLREKAQGK